MKKKNVLHCFVVISYVKGYVYDLSDTCMHFPKLFSQKVITGITEQWTCHSEQWKHRERAVIMPTSSSLVALQVVITIHRVTNDGKVGIMTILLLQYSGLTHQYSELVIQCSHWKLRVVIMPTLTSPVALQIAVPPVMTKLASWKLLASSKMAWYISICPPHGPQVCECTYPWTGSQCKLTGLWKSTVTWGKGKDINH